MDNSNQIPCVKPSTTKSDQKKQEALDPNNATSLLGLTPGYVGEKLDIKRRHMIEKRSKEAALELQKPNRARDEANDALSCASKKQSLVKVNDSDFVKNNMENIRCNIGGHYAKPALSKYQDQEIKEKEAVNTIRRAGDLCDQDVSFRPEHLVTPDTEYQKRGKVRGDKYLMDHEDLTTSCAKATLAHKKSLEHAERIINPDKNTFPRLAPYRAEPIDPNTIVINRSTLVPVPDKYKQPGFVDERINPPKLLPTMSASDQRKVISAISNPRIPPFVNDVEKWKRGVDTGAPPAVKKPTLEDKLKGRNL